MNEVALACQKPVDGIAEVAIDLVHPQSIYICGDTRNLHPSRRQLEEEQHEQTLQSFCGPHFDGEEVSCDY